MAGVLSLMSVVLGAARLRSTDNSLIEIQKSIARAASCVIGAIADLRVSAAVPEAQRIRTFR